MALYLGITRWNSDAQEINRIDSYNNHFWSEST
jgi:hypothetical protein